MRLRTSSSKRTLRPLVLNAKQLRSLPTTDYRLPSAKKRKPEAGKQSLRSVDRRRKSDIYIILDNVLDTYNIGSIFRLADAVGAKKLFLCGGTETPPNHRIKKASINTTEVVEWEYRDSAVDVIHDLRSSDRKLRLRDKIKDIQILGVEQTDRSVQYDKYEYKFPLAIIVGHETHGISPEVLKLCDFVVEIPMYGVNVSLNVMVSLGIVLYKALERATTH